MVLYRPRKNGFTLIELSIVLVIIGLIAGGIMTGRDLIEAAKVRKDIRLINEVRTAVNSFRIKYNALPGDMAAPWDFFDPSLYNTGFPGNVNGVIGDMRTDVVAYSMPAVGDAGNTCSYCWESTLFWQELSNVGLVNLQPFTLSIAVPDPQCTPGVGYPVLASSGSYGLTVSGRQGDKNYFYYGSRQEWVGNQFIRANSYFSNATAARMIDQKLDDGLAMSGKIQNIIAVGQDIYGNCHTSGVYQTVDGTYECGLRIEAGF